MLHKNHLFFFVLSLFFSCAVLCLYGDALPPFLPSLEENAPSYAVFSPSFYLPGITAAPQPKPTPAQNTNPEPVPVYFSPEATIATVSASGIKSGEIQCKNETDYAVDLSALRAVPLRLPEKTEKPYVLILHTHATEAYTPTSAMPYAASSEYRTRDTSRNVTAVGKRLSEMLNKSAVRTMNDATLNDDPVYSYSYKNSLALAEKHFSDGIGTGLIIDLHRDAMQDSDGTWLRTACTLPDGKEAAQIMLVVGTDAIGLAHPNWQENLHLAVHLQDTLEQLYPGITRPINIRRERFNGHVGNFQLLIEIGTNANTLEEALLSADCLSEALALLLQ